ncbi:DUF6434 domain-containing protein [Octadecabacter sp. R77987]|uniref:DUF6434 domain-containing protein n=1 Tax=Octadecabacter sp. R77987 TaxID=3093874 RepID=UPI00366FE899
MANPTRPNIATIKRGDDLRQWYWLKSELAAHAKTLGLRTSGAKFEILDRIAHLLDTGAAKPETTVRPKSSFDWHSANLTPETRLTDSYKNTQNVRRFFQAHADPAFKFNIAFMAWIKANTGLTLADAVLEYHAIKARAADPGYQTKIKGHNQFNQYTRDFMADNPDMGMDDVRRIWAKKRARPSPDGRHVYARTDLDL